MVAQRGVQCELDMKRVAINGFGRIGRAFFRLAQKAEDIDVVAINDILPAETIAYLLKHDTVYGVYPKQIAIQDGALCVDGLTTTLLSKKNPSTLPWKKLQIDTVVESTGIFSSYDAARAHLTAGAKRVIISAPVKDDPPEDLLAETVLVGVNTNRAKLCTITSNASCTTNAIGIPMKHLDEAVGIESAVLNTIHAYTATQHIVDGGSKKKGVSRFGRAGAANIIPSTTGAAIATAKALPQLEGKFDGIALRVPVAIGSIADVTFVASRPTSVTEINEVLHGAIGGLFTVTTEPIVSSDIIGEEFVAIADLPLTRVINGTLVKVMLWYDNEIGYARSLLEHVRIG